MGDTPPYTVLYRIQLLKDIAEFLALLSDNFIN